MSIHVALTSLPQQFYTDKVLKDSSLRNSQTAGRDTGMNDCNITLAKHWRVPLKELFPGYTHDLSQPSARRKQLRREQKLHSLSTVPGALTQHLYTNSHDREQMTRGLPRTTVHSRTSRCNG